MAPLPYRDPDQAARRPERPQEPASAPIAPRTRQPLGRGWVIGGAMVLAGVIGLLPRACGGDREGVTTAAAGRARVERVLGGTNDQAISACAPSGGPCRSLRAGAEVPAGSRLKTDFSTQVLLGWPDGARWILDRSSELLLTTGSARQAELVRGSFVVDMRGQSTPLSLQVRGHRLSAERAKFAVRSADADATIEVVRGDVEIERGSGDHIVVHAGERARLGAGAPSVYPAPNVGEALTWSERLEVAEAARNEGPRGLGELAAKKPGATQEIEGAVRLASHRTRIRISGAMARTEIEEVFTNTTDTVLEGIYRFPLPPDVKIERLALEVDGRLVEGAFVDRERAAAIWRGAITNAAPQARALTREEIVWVPGPWKDPALLEWQRGGRFELRVFPIPKRGSRRVVLAYTEHLKPSGDSRRYVYPLPHDPSGSTRVDQFEVDVQVRGHDRAFGVRSAGYELTQRTDGEVETLSLAREAFKPNGDLTLEYALPSRGADLSAFAYRNSELDAGGYVALALRPKLPRASDAGQRAFAIVVDSSRSMFGESFSRAKRLAARIARELDHGDRVVVLACDSECRTAPGGLVPPGIGAEAAALRFLDGIQPDGASDPVRAQKLAREALGSDGQREGRIVYIGDGASTVGPVRPAHIEAAVARAVPAGRVRLTTVAVGTESDTETLSALARGGGGVMVPYAPGQNLGDAAFAVLGAAYGRALRDVTVLVPDGLHAIAPRRLDAIPAGGEALVVARLASANIDGDVILRGRVGEEDFERRYPVRIVASAAPGNAFVPRLYAALRIRDLELEGSAGARQQALALSTEFNVASRQTSLLVLESPAMFRAFGLDNVRRAPEWSGEDETESTFGEALEPAAEEGVSLGGAADAFASEPAKRAEMRGRASSGGPFAPAPAAAPAAKAASQAPPVLRDQDELMVPRETSRRHMVPMRRIWERTGEVTTARLIPKAAGSDGISKAEQKAALDENRRENTRKLYALLAAAGEVERAERVVERWIRRDPLDPDALTARADLATRRGERELAIRLLGSVIDARPDDVAAQRRLERLHRWAGRAALGCRHLVAAAEVRSADAQLLADAVRCSRDTLEQDTAESLLAAATEDIRARATSLLGRPPHSDSVLSGDFRVEATWSGAEDLDLGLLDPDGLRTSWLGAPTRAVITARDVLDLGREGLALRGAKPGEYVIEIVRPRGGDPIRGEIVVHAAGAQRRVPFELRGTRASVALATIRVQPRLVPL